MEQALWDRLEASLSRFGVAYAADVCDVLVETVSLEERLRDFKFLFGGKLMDFVVQLRDLVAAVRAQDWWRAASIGAGLVKALIDGVRPQEARASLAGVPDDLDGKLTWLENHLAGPEDVTQVTALPWSVILPVVIDVMVEVFKHLR